MLVARLHMSRVRLSKDNKSKLKPHLTVLHGVESHCYRHSCNSAISLVHGDAGRAIICLFNNQSPITAACSRGSLISCESFASFNFTFFQASVDKIVENKPGLVAAVGSCPLVSTISIISRVTCWLGSGSIPGWWTGDAGRKVI